MATPAKDVFPAINLVPDREHIMGRRRPLVRPGFWVILAVAVAVLVAVMGILLVPRLL
jgi:hypothetical protein